MDSTGVSAAAYAITNQLYSLGLVVMLALQATGATLVPNALAKGTPKFGVQKIKYRIWRAILQFGDQFVETSSKLTTV